MDIRQLKYFCAIAHEGSISGAAKRLFMTQPSLSQQLQVLENELSVKLVDRGSRRLTLTEAGLLLKDRAEQILDLLAATSLEVKELHDGYKGMLSIGTIASSGVTLLPRFIREFHQQYPRVRYQLFEGDTPRILDLLSNGVIEIGIVRASFDSQLYHSLDLPTDPLIAAMAEKWIDHGGKNELPVNELAGKPLLLHRSNERMIVDVCRNFGFEPDVLCKGDDVRSLLVLANEGIGLALVPRSALGLTPGNTLHYRELDEASLSIQKAIVWMRNRYLSVAAEHFIHQIVEVDA